MAQKLLKIGVVGFSRNQFDHKRAQEILEKDFKSLQKKHPNKLIEIVSGYTHMGVPKLAYECAERYGFVTVGFSARQALRVKSGVYPVQKEILVGERFGDESQAFVDYIDGLIRVGGGKQSRKEVELFKSKHAGKPLTSLLKEYEVDWYGTPPALPKKEAGIDIPGLALIENLLSSDEQNQLIAEIDQESWSNELRRRVQHYGYKYNYKARRIDHSMKVGELPTWTGGLVERILSKGLMGKAPDQMIVNEYYPGQGIADHVDCEPCFGDTIISVSLGSQTVMNFTHKTSRQKVPKVLWPGSAIVLKGAARYEWMHGIQGKKSDLIAGKKVLRSRRISLTFRAVILS